MRQVMHQ